MQDEYVFGPTSPARISAQDNLVLKPPETQVCHTDPWRDDLLDRGDAAGELTKLLRNERSISISLSGAWGTGKTFFLRRWMKDLQRAGAKTAYVNAWESDFSHDPVIPITSSVAEAMQESRFRKATRALRQEVIDFLIINTESLLEKRIGIRLPILQKLRNKNRQKLDPYRARQAALKKLRETLETLARETWKDADHPLVIIIDELDRCRPDYAVELLERVKHVLRVEGVVFGLRGQSSGTGRAHRPPVRDLRYRRIPPEVLRRGRPAAQARQDLTLRRTKSPVGTTAICVAAGTPAVRGQQRHPVLQPHRQRRSARPSTRLWATSQPWRTP